MLPQQQRKEEETLSQRPCWIPVLSPPCATGSERISGLADCSHVTVARNCGGSHTVNSASQRRQSSKHYAHAEVDLVAQV